MRALVDADILLYEIGFSSQQTEDGKVIPASWEFAQDLLEKKIELIQDEVGATEAPILFLTNTPRINKLLNKKRKFEGQEKKEYVENFRVDIAKEKEYKGGRKLEKPFHFYNLLAHILGTYDFRVDENGLEADDLMCITQYSRLNKLDTTICSRDKDVRQCPGRHYSWECGGAASIGPIMVDELGWLENANEGKVDTKGKPKPFKIFGTGAKFFYAQLIMGDNVDNIAGVRKKGQVFAYKLLKDATTVRECYELVAEVYVKDLGDEWKTKIKEMADLLYMIREYDEHGKPKLWLPPPRDT